MNTKNLNEQKDKGKEIKIKMKLKNNKYGKLKIIHLYEGDKASKIRDKYNIKQGFLINNYKCINEALSIKENEILNGSILYVTNSIYNVTFRTKKAIAS